MHSPHLSPLQPASGALLPETLCHHIPSAYLPGSSHLENTSFLSLSN